MTNAEILIKALDTAHWEMGEAFKGLADEDVWKRPHPRLLSIGELGAHVGYWEAKSFLPDDFETSLSEPAARYYPVSVEDPQTLLHGAEPMGAEALYAEITRIHQACKAALADLNPDLQSDSPYREGWTWHTVLEYQAFHFAYHTGQMYSVRHLMGHETVDN